MADADSRLFREDLVFCGVDVPSKEALFERLADVLSEKGYIKDSWIGAIEEREATYATGLGFPGIRVAIPHVDPEHIVTPYIAVVRPSKPVTFQAMAGIGGDVEAQLIINLGVMRDGGQVAVLQRLMNVFMDDERAQDILAQKEPKALLDTLVRHFEAVSDQ